MLTGIAAVTSLLATSAFAADLPMQTYTKAPLFVESVFWTGFYVGGNVGHLWVGFLAPDAIATQENALKVAQEIGREAGGLAVTPSVAQLSGVTFATPHPGPAIPAAAQTQSTSLTLPDSRWSIPPVVGTRTRPTSIAPAPG